MINLSINNKLVSVPEGSTILEAAKHNKIDIPNLCNLDGVHKFGSCRLCVVEVEGDKNLQASCMVQVRDGMVVHTNTDKVRKVRKNLFELMLSNHPQDCLKCQRSLSCELQNMGKRLGVTEARYTGQTSGGIVDISPAISRDMVKCILCRRCITACNDIQKVGILNAQNSGFKTVVGTALDLPINTVNCTFCGQCVAVCPVGALKETDAIQNVWGAISDKCKRVVVQVDPAVRAAIGEEFGYEPGTQVTAQLIAALREVGFDVVFDTNFAADLTVIEASSEFLTRMKYSLGGMETPLPMMSSCSPAWIKYVEHTYPEKLGHLSTCKSPHTMLGALAKSYYAEILKVEPKNMAVVSIMPCTAKKFEISRPEMTNNGLANVDAVLTTREIARMMQEAGVDLRKVGKSQFDQPFELSSGAAELFGLSGGVMEATLRTVHEMVTGRELAIDKLHAAPLEECDQVKDVELRFDDPLEAYQYMAGITIKVAVASGLRGAGFLMDQITKQESPYSFIEVMGCPGGCISGGGQPRPATSETLQKRLQAIYLEDEVKPFRKAHQNEGVTKLYKEFLKEPNGRRAQDLLHTQYTKRGKFNEYLCD
ncbi:NADH-dependent [FeFe] hydrogenase, group A6 [Desulfosporosinus shakirovi]|uniref:NADH-dependent [FeFe] hydrogenase, group A6 n=1 Tax=Desulfosporosinus shakirovi TaxID=2885154 RepID=UPI001E4E785F|nr:NADH-dependent [FeFe] hydrogenase, group A6 [Desulfosporosinus sp. SRJS8]MCB8815134.1 [FeFe] hydrogenase, group A [Desulfosporosinus sp. SRJS8]